MIYDRQHSVFQQNSCLGNPKRAKLYGISFYNLYKIDPSTAIAQLIGAHHIPDGNALAFSKDGKLYGAGNSTTYLYLIDINTGNSTTVGNIGFYSSGDLAFNGDKLFMTSTSGELIEIDLTNNGRDIDVGPVGFPDVYGLATTDNGITYGLSGTKLLLINLNTGSGTFVLNYSGQGLGNAYGASYLTASASTSNTSKVGVFRNGTWYLDYNGNGAWDGCGVDRCYFGSFGQQGDLPVAGKW